MIRRKIFSVPVKETKQVRIHKDLVTVLEREKNKQQRIADMKYGKTSPKVGLSFASKVLGGFLK